MVKCRKCGKEWDSWGALGGHMTGHRVSNGAKELLEAIRTIPGLAPRQYAELIGISRSSVDSGAANLRKVGKMYSTGSTKDMRYFPGKIKQPELVDEITVEKRIECQKCGKEMNTIGYGSHLRSHRVTQKGRELLKIIKNNPGLHTREYAELLGISSEAVSSRVITLKKLDKIRSEGKTSGIKYYLKGYELSKPKVSEIIPEIINMGVEPQAIAMVPEGLKQMLGAENIFTTKDGTTLMFKDGELYTVKIGVEKVTIK